MLTDSPIIAFVGSQSPAEARRFYEKDLGLSFVADEPFALVFDANGIMLRVTKLSEFEPLVFTVLGWEVKDIQGKVDGLTERGVRIERFDGFEQDERGIATFPGGTQVAWFKDPDGNMLSLTQLGD